MTNESWPFPVSKPDPKPELIDIIGDYSTTEDATAVGVRFAHLFEPGRKGGCTVAYRPVSFAKNSKMLEIALAYTHPRDQYVRKTGAELAAQRWLDGQTVTMPLRGRDNHETQYNLWRAFYNSVYSQEIKW
jgi:hypothetical protein